MLNPRTNTSAADVVVTFYDQAGNVKDVEEDSSVAPGTVAFWYVPNLKNLSPGQTYSAVVSSDLPVYATVNLSSQNPATAETYDGVNGDTGSNAGTAMLTGPTEYIPSVTREYYGASSTLTVQNAGNVATPILVHLLGQSSIGAVDRCVTSPALPPKAAWTLDLESLGSNGLPDVGTAFNGAATVYGGSTSNCGQAPSQLQPIAVITNQYRPDQTPPQFGSTNAVASGAANAYIPGLYSNYYGASSSLIVQNVDSTPANVVVTYQGRSGDATDVAMNLAPGASKLFYTPNAGRSVGSGALPAGWQGSATVTSTGGQKIITQVNIAASNGLASYNGFSDGTTQVFAPGLYKGYYGANSSLTIQNVDTAAGKVTITYTNGCSEQVLLSPGESQLLYIPNRPCLQGVNAYNGGATVTSDGPKIVGLIGTSGSGTGSFDSLYATNAFGANLLIP